MSSRLLSGENLSFSNQRRFIKARPALIPMSGGEIHLCVNKRTEDPHIPGGHGERPQL